MAEVLEKSYTEKPPKVRTNGHAPVQPSDFKRDLFEQDVLDWFQLKKAGHMDNWTYHSGTRPSEFPGGDESWSRFLTEQGGLGGPYYVYREDIENIRNSIPMLKKHFGEAKCLIDLGSGDELAFNSKARPLIEKLDQLTTYMPVDTSCALLQQVKNAAQTQFPQLKVHDRTADFYTGKTNEGKQLTLKEASRLSAVFGSTVTNMEMGYYDPFPTEELINNIAALIKLTKGGDARREKCGLAFTYDSNRDLDSVLEAYNSVHWRRLILGVMYDIDSMLISPQKTKKDLGSYSPTEWRVEHQAEGWPNRRVVQYCVVANKKQDFSIGGQEINIDKDSALVAFNILKPEVDQMLDISENACERAGGGIVLPPKVHKNKRMVLQALEI